jgi:ArsR family metal-binding transcriptional regulator
VLPTAEYSGDAPKRSEIVLLDGYRLEIFNNECMPGAMSVQCFAHLDQDVGPAIPYLNAELGGFAYISDPPSVTFRVHGKLITVHGRKIAVNALKDETEARKIVEWLRREINDVWQRRETITPRYRGASRPQLMEILKRLPRTNCRQCGEPTCMVFASRVIEGAKGLDACPPLKAVERREIEAYLEGFGPLDPADSAP